MSGARRALTYSWLIDATERAVKTAAQSALAMIAVGATASAWDVDWQQVAGVALLGAILSLLTSAASARLSGGAASIAASATAPRVASQPGERGAAEVTLLAAVLLVLLILVFLRIYGIV